MNRHKMRQLATEVFKNADDELVMQFVLGSDPGRLPVAELDDFKRYLAEEAAKEPEIDTESLFRHEKKPDMTKHKPSEPLNVHTGRSAVKDFIFSKDKEKSVDSDILASLFSGPGSLDVKSPKIPKQENEFPMGLKAFETSLEPQENHSDEGAFD